MTGILEPAVLEKTMHLVYKYECEECGKIVESVVDLAKKGKFGKNVITEITAAFLERLPY